MEDGKGEKKGKTKKRKGKKCKRKIGGKEKREKEK